MVVTTARIATAATVTPAEQGQPAVSDADETGEQRESGSGAARVGVD